MTGMSSGRGRMPQAEVVQDRAADESGDCRDKVVVADELQGCGVGGGGGHYSPTHAQGLKHVVDGVTQPSPAGDGDVFGGRAALKGERAVAQRMGGAQGEDEPVVAHELVADLGRGGLAGSGFEVDVSSSRVMGVGTGFGHEAQTYSGCLGAQGVEQGWAGCRGQSVVPFQNESSLQGCQVDFWVGGREPTGPAGPGRARSRAERGRGGGSHGSTGADEDLVSGGPADAAQGAAHRGAETWRRAAASVTLPSSSRASSAVSRFPPTVPRAAIASLMVAEAETPRFTDADTIALVESS